MGAAAAAQNIQMKVWTGHLVQSINMQRLLDDLSSDRKRGNEIRSHLIWEAQLWWGSSRCPSDSSCSSIAMKPMCSLVPNRRECELLEVSRPLQFIPLIVTSRTLWNLSSMFDLSKGWVFFNFITVHGSCVQYLRTQQTVQVKLSSGIFLASLFHFNCQICPSLSFS